MPELGTAVADALAVAEDDASATANAVPLLVALDVAVAIVVWGEEVCAFLDTDDGDALIAAVEDVLSLLVVLEELVV